MSVIYIQSFDNDLCLCRGYLKSSLNFFWLASSEKSDCCQNIQKFFHFKSEY